MVSECCDILVEHLIMYLLQAWNKPILIHCNNLSNIQLTKDPVFHARTKHIEVHYHYIRECILVGAIHLQYIGTNKQVADIFTKAEILSGSRP